MLPAGFLNGQAFSCNMKPWLLHPVPAETGLKSVVDIILKSENPLPEIAKTLGSHLFQEGMISFRGRDYQTAKEFVDEMQTEMAEYQKEPLDDAREHSTLCPLEFLARGVDYISLPEQMLENRFPFGDIAYHWVDIEKDGYNRSFAVALFPKETVTIGQKHDMKTQFAGQWFEPRYLEVKTLLLQAGDGRHYLALLPGDQRADFKEIGRTVDASGNILLYHGNPQQVVGRTLGSIGPFLARSAFPRISGVCFDEDLLVAYDRPFYSFPIDKRSSLVVANAAHIGNILENIQGYPRIFRGGITKAQPDSH